jgi:delta1-piperideine-2-carboxylate reductase
MSTTLVSLAEIAELTTQVFTVHGCDAANTAALVRTVVAAERDGSHSHGLFRVPGYVAALRSGKVNGKAAPRIGHKSPVVISVHGDDGFAPLAIEHTIAPLSNAARTFGVALAAITHSHHFAALWPETEALAERGLIALACVCYMPVMAPAGGRQPLLGTNPLAIAWPRPGRSPVVLDMATAAMARGEVSIAAREGRAVPLGTGLDAAGQPTTDPQAILDGVMLPFGGHKGSGLAVMIELLAAGAIGERFSFEAAAADNHDGGPPRGGEFLLALDPDVLAGPGWAEHCEGFFARFDAIEGARLPGSRRHANRSSQAPRAIDTQLLARVRELAVSSWCTGDAVSVADRRSP